MGAPLLAAARNVARRSVPRAAVLLIGVGALLSAAPSNAAAAASAPDYLALAEQGIAQQAGHWRTSQDGWYCEVLGCTGAYPLLTIWGVVRMFESADAVALADPTRTHRATVDWFAAPVHVAVLEPLPAGLRPLPRRRLPQRRGVV